jgi:hypothetical protein
VQCTRCSFSFENCMELLAVSGSPERHEGRSAIEATFIGSEIHWSHTNGLEIILGLEALLDSLSFLVPRHRTEMFCGPFRELDISSTITFSAGRINPADMYRACTHKIAIDSDLIKVRFAHFADSSRTFREVREVVAKVFSALCRATFDSRSGANAQQRFKEACASIRLLRVSIHDPTFPSQRMQQYWTLYRSWAVD